MRKLFLWLWVSFCIGLIFAGTAFCRADKTTYPVFLVHGVLGWDQTLDSGSWYFGDDFGVSVGDTCSFFEIGCNPNIDRNQEVYHVQLTSLESTFYRGNELFNIIDAYLLNEGIKRLGAAAQGMPPDALRAAIAMLGDRPYVNLIGHSQGGIDCRYVAKRLYEEYSYPVVKVLVTVSSPHRGSGIAGAMYALKDSNPLLYSSILWFFEEIWCGILSNGYKDGKEQSGVNMLKSMAYYDLDPADGEVTGMKAFNENCPVSDLYAAKYVSFMTAEKRSHLSPAMAVLVSLSGDIDGNVYEMDPDDCPVADRHIDQCNTTDTSDLRDDDGFIPLYSQHMGLRMQYNDNFWFDDTVAEIPVLGDLRDLNHPTAAQMGQAAQIGGDPDGMAGVIDAGHFEEITLPLGPLLNLNGGVTFDELGYYSAMIDYIADNE